MRKSRGFRWCCQYTDVALFFTGAETLNHCIDSNTGSLLINFKEVKEEMRNQRHHPKKINQTIRVVTLMAKIYCR